MILKIKSTVHENTPFSVIDGDAQANNTNVMAMRIDNDDMMGNDNYSMMCDEPHTITLTLNGYLLPEFINLMSILKTQCDVQNTNGGSVHIPNCQCGNEDFHDENKTHRLIIGENNIDKMHDFTIDDKPNIDWIEEQCKGNKILKV